MFSTITKLYLLIVLFEQCSAENNTCLFYPDYHIAPPHGWMNDPNGFSIFKGLYHLFYQYNPKTSQEPGIANWGHAKSKDLIFWNDLPIAMKPDQAYDKTGVFSGSAIVVNGTLYLIYTGNVNYPDQEPDHIQRQALAYTTDGVNVTKYEGNPIIMGNDYQPNIRDPKVWKHDDTYYLVLGNSFANNTLGRVLLYSSKDLITWEMVSILAESDGFLGYMWECPDFFQLGEYWVLLFSPQGIKTQGDKYRNLYQTGYIIGTFSYDTLAFTVVKDFQELDHGHDFYATQTLLDTDGRRIMIAWFDMWEQVYPERNEGWTGQMTLPRVLTITSDLNILQTPVKEIKCAREKLINHIQASISKQVTLKTNKAEIILEASKRNNFVLILDGGNVTVTISYDVKNGTITLDRGGEDGLRRTEWNPKSLQLHIRIFIDRSSVEMFCGDGEVTFSSRIFPSKAITIRSTTSRYISKFVVYGMKRTVPIPAICKE